MDALAEIRGIYFDECDEFTGLLEGYLAAMAEGRATSEDINGAFRAVHSIKGGAGAFGLSALVNFAHRFEACLDALRSGRVSVHAAPIDVLLQAGDVLTNLVQASRDGATLPIDSGLLEALEAFCGGTPKQAVPAEFAIEPEPAPAEEAAPPAPSRRPVTVRITPDADLFRRAIDPRVVFEALAGFGALELTCDTSAIPPLDSLDPLTCHLAWTAVVNTDATPGAIVEAIDCFLADHEFTVLDGSDADHASAPANQGDTPSPQADAVAQPGPAASADAAAVAKPEPAAVTAPGRRAGGGTIRVDLDRIDKLMNLVGEIVITQSMLTERATMLPKREAAVFVDALFSLNRQTRELQDNVMAVRAQPVKVVFQRLPRLVRELERSLGKKAELKLAGEDTEVDKTIVEELADPLIHMIRNAMDHGLESPEDRLAAGKPQEGVIRVSAEHRGSRILISISDDGKGIDRDRLIEKARSRGLIAPDVDLTPEEADNLIFHPGLSTAAKVTDVSGRGVGMDVVRRNVEALGGRITVESSPGRGCKFTLGLPLTLAVLDGMIVRAGAERFVFPLSSIVETMQLDSRSVEPLPGGRSVLRLRGEVAPIIRLRDLLGIRALGNEPNVVIVETDSVPRLAIAVDEIVGQQQVVVKNLESSFRRVEGVSAATILGDGLVALILDVDALPAMTQTSRRAPPMTGMYGAA
ncbi:chemotaxis protein CheA [Alsobacter sp. SYSU M60028]|uniref:Chemotaxis protein CheA n=1 Tax=Alsobacter ponti TaxID=2962936 RepID=A0ABT1LA58_9HYPH|nr:chemotaxis protein CheA [Alsobacter ponti]MCP8937823.1 chemotaxis protein CheA [Alsobacter ponti]